MDMQEFAQCFTADAERDRFGVTLFGEKTTGGWPKMVVMGTTDQVKQCENCGRMGLKHAIVCAVVDESGHATKRFHYFGSDCASKIAGKSQKEIEDKAANLGEFKPGIRMPRPVKPMDSQKSLFAAKGDGMNLLKDQLTAAWHEHHGVAEPAGFDLFGDPVKAPKPEPKKAAPAPKETQGALFNTKGLPNQTSFLDEAGVPDDLVRKPKKDLFDAIDWALIVDHFAARKPAPNQKAFDFNERPKLENTPIPQKTVPAASFPSDSLVQKKNDNAGGVSHDYSADVEVPHVEGQLKVSVGDHPAWQNDPQFQLSAMRLHNPGTQYDAVDAPLSVGSKPVFGVRYGSPAGGFHYAHASAHSPDDIRLIEPVGHGAPSGRPSWANRFDSTNPLPNDAIGKKKDLTPQAADAKPAPLYEVPGDNGMVSRVFKHENGYSVVLHDQDAGESVPNVRIYPPHDLDGAKRYAHSIAGPAPVAAPGVFDQDQQDTNDVANARKWKNNGDGTYTSPNGTVWRKAKAGGETSPVTGKPFKGGALMPIHGLASGRPKPDPKQGPAADVKPRQQQWEAPKVRQLSPEEIEQRRIGEERERKWSEVQAGPLGRALGLGDRIHNIRGGHGIAKQWMVEAESMGPETTRRVADVAKQVALENLIADYRQRKQENPEQEAREQLEFSHRFHLEANANMGDGLTKKHKANHPHTDEARHWVTQALSTGNQVDTLHRIHQAIGGNMISELQQRFAAAWVVDWVERYGAPDIENHRGLVADVGKKMGVRQNDMDDFIQDVMVRALKASDSYEPERGKVSTWLTKIATSAAINRHRDANAKKRGGDAVTTSMHGKASVLQIPDHREASNAAEHNDLREHIHRHLQHLTSTQQTAIKGRLDNKSFDQIATESGQKKTTIKMASDVGTKRLKEMIGPQDDPQRSMDTPDKGDKQMELFAAWCDQHLAVERYGQMGFSFSDDDGQRPATAPTTPSPTFQKPKQLGLFDSPPAMKPQSSAVGVFKPADVPQQPQNINPEPVAAAQPAPMPDPVDPALQPKSDDIPADEKRPIESPPKTPLEHVETSYNRAVVQDFGRVIPEARKHTAVARGSKPKAEKDSRPGWARRYQVSFITKSKKPGEEGKWAIYDTRQKHWTGGYHQVGKLFDSEEEAHRAVPLLEVARNHRVYNRGNAENPNFAIVRKITDNKRAVVVGGFKTEQDAMKHMVVNAPQIIEHKFPRYEDYQYLDNVERNGPPKRTDTVTGPEFQSAFNVSGGQFGNWQTNKDGVTSMNHAYDAFHDLADALEVDPKHIGLNGRLALAFGARGTGGKNSARAHYEPAYKVINLTKMYGAGTLAHEWSHALDHLIANVAGSTHHTAIALQERNVKHPEVRAALSNLFSAMHHTEVEEQVMDTAIADKRKKAQEEYEKAKAEGGYMSGDSPQAHAFRAVWEAKSRIQYRKGKMPPGAMERLEAAASRIAKLDFGARVKVPPSKLAGRYNTGRDSYEALEELNKAYKEVTGHSYYTSHEHSPGLKMYWGLWRHDKDNEKLAEWQSGKRNMVKKQSAFKRDAHILDSTLGDDYYQLPEEMMARSFESYIADKLEGMGRRSDYLVSASKTMGDAYRELFGASPFPEGEERQKINAAFDHLFHVLKTHNLWGTPNVRFDVGDQVQQHWANSWVDRCVTMADRLHAIATIERFAVKPMKNQTAFDFDAEPKESKRQTSAIKPPPPPKPDLARKMFGRRVTGVHVRELQDMKRPTREDYYHKLTGHQLSDDPTQHVHELAKKAQAYRDPRFETFRAFFVDRNHQIVAHNAYSSRHPSAVAFVHDFGQQVQDDLKASGAHRVFFMHNHPSGNPEPSGHDQMFTHRLQDTLGDAYGGHIIVNHTKYSYHSPLHRNAAHWETGDVENEMLAGPQHAHARDRSVLGQPITNPDDLAKLFLRSGTSRDKMTVFLTNIKNHIRAVFDVDPEHAKNMNPKTLGAILRMQRQFAGHSMFAAVPQGHDPEDYRHLVENGLMTDMVRHTADGLAPALMGSGPTKPFINRKIRMARSVRYQAMDDIIPLVDRFAADEDREGKHPRPPRPDDMGPPAAKAAPIKAKKSESFHVAHLVPRDEVRLRDNVKLQNGQVLPKGHAVQFVKHDNGLVHVKHGGSDIPVAIPINKVGIHRNEIQRKGGEHALRRGMEHDGQELHDMPASQFVNRGAGQIVRDQNTNKGYLLHGGKLYELRADEWKWNHAEQRGLTVSPMDVRHRIHRDVVLANMHKTGNVTPENKKRYADDLQQQIAPTDGPKKQLTAAPGWFDRQASLRRTAANPPRLGPSADPSKEKPTVYRQANEQADQMQRRWLNASRGSQLNREMNQISVRPPAQQPPPSPANDEIPWWSQMEGKAEDFLWKKSEPMRDAFYKAWNEAKAMGQAKLDQAKAAIKAAPGQAWQGMKSAPGNAARAIGSMARSAIDRLNQPAQQPQAPTIPVDTVKNAKPGDTIRGWTKQVDRNTGLSFWFHPDPSQGALTDEQFHQSLNPAPQPNRSGQPAGSRGGLGQTGIASVANAGGQSPAAQPPNAQAATPTPASSQAAPTMPTGVNSSGTGNAANKSQSVGNNMQNQSRLAGPVPSGSGGPGTAAVPGTAQVPHRAGNNAGKSAPVVGNSAAQGGMGPVAGSGSTGGVASAPQPRPKLNNLVRAFHAGSNQGSIQFADDVQRDLHDYAANEVYKNRGGQNRTRNRSVKQWDENALAQRAGVDRNDLFQHAHKTYLDVLRQTKGIRHGEHRVIKPFDQARYDQESQALTKPAPRQSGAPTASAPTPPPPQAAPIRPADQWSPPKAAIAPIAVGTESVISVPGGKDIPTKYVLMDLNHVAASHNYQSGGPRSEPRYPQGLQPREYTHQSSNDFKVRDMAQQRKAGYYMQHPDATSGAPVVTPDGVAINGNGRVMSLQLAASQNDYGWYKDELKKQAAQLGLNPADVDRVQHPVLVRMVPMDAESAEAREFARAGNITTTQQDSPTRTGASLGGLIDNEVLKSLSLEGDETLSDLLSRGNHPMLTDIYSHVPSQVRDLYFTPNRQLTDAGKEMVTDMLLSKLLPVDLIEQMGAGSKSLKNAIEGGIPQLMSLQHRVDITPQLNEAITHLMKFPGDTTPELVDQTLQQGGLWEGAKVTLSPGARMMVDFLLASRGNGNSYGKLKVRHGLVNLAKRLSQRGGMFGDEKSLEEDAADALGVTVRDGARFGRFAAYEWASVQRFHAVWAEETRQRFDFAS